MRLDSPVLLLLALSVTSTAAADADGILERAVADGRVPGVVAMVATVDEVIYAKAAGFADVEGQVPMREDSIFRIASMTKPVTSVAVMQLVADGEVDLDAPVDRYLDDFTPKRVLLAVDDGQPSYSEATYVPTVRQLLSHTSGFAYGVWNDRLLAITDLSSVSATSFIGEPLVFEPGTDWHYSTSTDWAGLIVERVSGLSLQDFFRRRITQPLAMGDTGYDVDAASHGRVVTRHQRGVDGRLTELPNDPFRPATFYSGGAGLYSTAADYVRFMQMLLSEGGDDPRILPRALVREMGQNQIDGLEVGVMRTSLPAFSNDFDIYPDVPAKFGLGFLINERDLAGRRRAGSLTWGGLYNTYFWIDRDSGLCGVLLTQILPFYDGAVIDLLAEFEAAIYAHVAGR